MSTVNTRPSLPSTLSILSDEDLDLLIDVWTSVEEEGYTPANERLVRDLARVYGPGNVADARAVSGLSRADHGPTARSGSLFDTEDYEDIFQPVRARLLESSAARPASPF
jgi:hypothetical protein